jgi:hypothetical protein
VVQWKDAAGERCTVMLRVVPDPDAPAALGRLLRTLTDNVIALQRASGQLASSCESLNKRLLVSQGQVQKYVQTKEEIQKDWGVKVSRPWEWPGGAALTRREPCRGPPPWVPAPPCPAQRSAAQCRRPPCPALPPGASRSPRC